MNIYIDIDGVILEENKKAVPGIPELISELNDRHALFWFSERLGPGGESIDDILSPHYDETAMHVFNQIQSSFWRDYRTQGINFREPFQILNVRELNNQEDKAIATNLPGYLYNDRAYEQLSIDNAFTYAQNIRKLRRQIYDNQFKEIGYLPITNELYLHRSPHTALTFFSQEQVERFIVSNLDYFHNVDIQLSKHFYDGGFYLVYEVSDESLDVTFPCYFSIPAPDSLFERAKYKTITEIIHIEYDFHTLLLQKTNLNYEQVFSSDSRFRSYIKSRVTQLVATIDHPTKQRLSHILKVPEWILTYFLDHELSDKLYLDKTPAQRLSAWRATKTLDPGLKLQQIGALVSIWMLALLSQHFFRYTTWSEIVLDTIGLYLLYRVLQMILIKNRKHSF